MRQSQLFTKTRKERPAEEDSRNAELLIQAGFIHKEMAGVYAYLPLGFRVLEKIKKIIQEEMNAIGGQEVLLTTLQNPKPWEKSGRWDDAVVDNWFKTELKNGEKLGIANTHEEPLTNILLEHISSYKDLPAYVYQIQTKFRNELRAKNGLLRCREFLMKDLYSFNRDEKDFKEFYELCSEAYMKIFRRAGIGDAVYRTIAAGGSFTTGYTDEFQAIAQTGEDIIYIDDEKRIAVNKEVYTEDTLKKFGLDKKKLREERSIEVGNIFPLGTKYPKALGLYYQDEKGKKKLPIMGSYGIGLGRLMATVVELHSDDKGIQWTKELAPFHAHLIVLQPDNAGLAEKAEALYGELGKNGIDVLFDDRLQKTAGEKFADADLIGIPLRIVFSEKTAKEDSAELKERGEGKTHLVKLSNLIHTIHA